MHLYITKSLVRGRRGPSISPLNEHLLPQVFHLCIDFLDDLVIGNEELLYVLRVLLANQQLLGVGQIQSLQRLQLVRDVHQGIKCEVLL